MIGASPAAVVIIAGVNDVYQGRPSQHVIAQLRTMYDRAAHAGIRVVAGTIVPYNTATAEPERADARDQRLDPRPGRATNPRSPSPTPEPLLQHPGDADGWPSPPTASIRPPRGYRRMAEAIQPVLDRVLRGIL